MRPREMDSVIWHLSDGFDKDAFLVRLAKLQASMPMTEAVVERMRQENRY